MEEEANWIGMEKTINRFGNGVRLIFSIALRTISGGGCIYLRISKHADRTHMVLTLSRENLGIGGLS